MTITEAIKNLYTPTRDGARFMLPADFPAFSGHFPGEPVLPAVVQIQMAVYVIGERAGRAAKLREIKKAKFSAPVRTGEEIEIIITPSRHENCFDAAVKSGDKTASSFTVAVEL
ncbi:MAG: hypothetical protein LBL61_05840 [Elusimicrobiota bacterium]|jgi:3-hydroxyacyl-[acyl-carrier-protein] dehydratase|nr:hypothetical protein [Elusimicrobiota bacterium]